MAPIRYLVPYQYDIFMREEVTNQTLINTFYWKCGVQLDTAPPAYGAPIAGASDNQILHAAIDTEWTTGIMTVISAFCTTVSSRLRAIVGWRYPTPLRAIASINNGPPVELTTASPHGLSSTDTVVVSGVTIPAGLNATWPIAVTGPNSFQLIGAVASGVWTGGGYIQRVNGDVQLSYADNNERSFTQIGSITGDMMPSYVSVDIKRGNAGTGRAFRSRIGLGTIGESQQVGGQLTSAARIAITNAFSTFTNFTNGGSDSSSGISFSSTFSKSVAFGQPTPFTSSNGFVAPVIAYVVRENLGSQNQRKVRG